MRIRIEEKHPNWKGDKASYDSIHSWVERRRGKPHICEHCGKYVENLKCIHWANVDHTYKRDLDDYIRLCASCHGRYDKINNLRTHKHQYYALKN